MRIEKVTDKIKLYNCDCMEYMKDIPDKYYDLAIVDPPYGLDKSSTQGSGQLKNKTLNRGNMEWDIAPNKEYFDELFRVSKNQIIWGGNYFELPPCRCFVCWDKQQVWENFSQVEFAWTSFNMPAKFKSICNRGGEADKGKFHPTQKPIKLYKYLLKTFSSPTDKILDTHFGSCSIGVACHDWGCQLDACEIDEKYFDSAYKRLKIHVGQLELFR